MLKKIILSILLFALTLGVATAAEFKSDGQFTFTSAVSDNLISSGGIVDIDSVIERDLVTAGGQVNVKGKIGQNLMVAAGQADVNATVGQDAFIASGTIKLNNSTLIEGDLNAAGGGIEINGEIKGNLNVDGGTIILNAKVGKNANVNGELIIGSKAEINGKLTNIARTPAKIDPAAQIRGSFEQKFAAKATPIKIQGKFISIFIQLLSLLLIGGLLLLILPKLPPKLVENLQNKFWQVLIAGLAFLLLIPLVILLLMVTIVGFPLGVSVLALYLIAIYLSIIFSGFAFGQLIAGRKILPFWSLALGLIIILILRSTPVIGGLINLLSVLIGLGLIGIFAFKNKFGFK